MQKQKNKRSTHAIKINIYKAMYTRNKKYKSPKKFVRAVAPPKKTKKN